MFKKLILAAFVAASFGGVVVSTKPAEAEITFEYGALVVQYQTQVAPAAPEEDNCYAWGFCW